MESTVHRFSFPTKTQKFSGGDSNQKTPQKTQQWERQKKWSKDVIISSVRPHSGSLILTHPHYHIYIYQQKKNRCFFLNLIFARVYLWFSFSISDCSIASLSINSKRFNMASISSWYSTTTALTTPPPLFNSSIANISSALLLTNQTDIVKDVDDDDILDVVLLILKASIMVIYNFDLFIFSTLCCSSTSP